MIWVKFAWGPSINDQMYVQALSLDHAERRMRAKRPEANLRVAWNEEPEEYEPFHRIMFLDPLEALAEGEL